MGRWWATRLTAVALALVPGVPAAQRMAPSKAAPPAATQPATPAPASPAPTVAAPAPVPLVSTVVAGTYTNSEIDPTQTVPASSADTESFQATTPDSVIVNGSGSQLTIVFDEIPNPNFPAEISFILVSTSKDGSDLKYRSIGMGFLLQAEFIATLTADGTAVAPVGPQTKVPDIRLIVSGTYNPLHWPGMNPWINGDYAGPHEPFNRTYVPTRTVSGLPRGQAQPVDDSHTDYDHTMTQQNKFIGLDFSEQGYDITGMNEDVGKPANKERIFALGGPGAYHFNPGQPFAIPDGFIFVSLAHELKYHSTEMVASSDTESSKDTSWTVGVSGGDTKTDGGSASYGMSTMQKISTDSSSLLAISDAILLDSRIVLDKANVTLADQFASDMRNLIRAPSPAAASVLIDLYGTHYPHAITYGARGVNLRTVTVSTFASMAASGMEASGTGTVDTASATGAYTSKQIEANKTGTTYSTEDFHSIGTPGATNFGAFASSKETQAPILFDLRPIAELVSPLFFPDEDPRQMLYARESLNTATQEHIWAAPTLDASSHFPDMFRVTIQGVTCTGAYDNFNKPEGSSNVYGELNATFPQSLIQSGKTELWASDAPVGVSCDGASPFTSTRTSVIAVSRGADATVSWHGEFGLREAFSDRHAWGGGSFDARALVGKTKTFSVQNGDDAGKAPTYKFTVGVDRIRMR